jgi:hypothetical protein
LIFDATAAKIEVKLSAYCQSWFQSKPSTIQFSIRKAVFWNPATGAYEGEATRSADVYVFCLHTEIDKVKANVLDVAAWSFFIVPTPKLNQEFGRAKSISLATVQRLAVACKFDRLRAAVDATVSCARNHEEKNSLRAC